MSPLFCLKGLKRIEQWQLKMSFTKFSLKYMLTKYFKFQMSFDLRVSKFIMILRGFQVEMKE